MHNESYYEYWRARDSEISRTSNKCMTMKEHPRIGITQLLSLSIVR